VSSHASASSGQLRWRLAAAALTVAAVVCLLMWGARSAPESEASPPSGPTTSSPSATDAVASDVADVPAVVTPARPVSLSIPSIDVQTRLIRLGLRDDGSVEVPSDANADLAGWFQRGPPPGSRGSSVILGHVDSTTGPAVFFRLSELQPGQRLSVELDDGTTATFRVRSVRTYANEDFPAQRVYGRQGRSELNLVTCGGVYDSSRGGYQSNVVVNARLV
jgi:sortase (surface protein transpeptidase)